MNEEVKTKKHIGIPGKILLFLFLSFLYCISVLSTWILYQNGVHDYLCSLIVLIPLAVDLIITAKTDCNPLLFVLSPLPVIILCIILLYQTLGSNEIYTMLLVSMFNFAVRIFATIIHCITAKKFKLIPICLLITLMIGGVTVLGLSMEFEIRSHIRNRTSGQTDITASWGSINQNIGRSDNWKQIVTDSPFKIGEIEEVTDEDGFYRNECNLGTYPYIDGSTVCVPLAVEFARQHLGFDDETANQFVMFSTTHYAYENLMDPTSTSKVYFTSNHLNTYIDMGSVNLVLATEPSDEEIAQAESVGITFMKEPVCHDAFVFITHKDNPVDSLTVEQIQKIYSGEIKNWKDVGGKNERIRAFQREKNSGSQTAMENLVMGGSNMIDPIEVRIITGMGMLVDAVAEYENETASIGYTYRYYIDNLYKNDNIKTISVEGIAPTDENIRNKTYPFSTSYYGVIRQGDGDKVGGQFLKWILSDEGQKCVEQAGYITLK